jgi:hypothetical protein
MVTGKKYWDTHMPVRRTYGPASQWQCVDCGKMAREWSQIHDTDPYNVENYEPRCVSCHRKYDYTDETRKKISESMKGNTNGQYSWLDRKYQV